MVLISGRKMWRAILSAFLFSLALSQPPSCSNNFKKLLKIINYEIKIFDDADLFADSETNSDASTLMLPSNVTIFFTHL